jgi:hypothetical protein
VRRWYLEVLSGVADMAGSGEERQRHNGRGEGRRFGERRNLEWEAYSKGARAKWAE